MKPAEPAETETATRPVEEVTGGTEEPEAKKAKVGGIDVPFTGYAVRNIGHP